jgi:hypothetical protein
MQANRHDQSIRTGLAWEALFMIRADDPNLMLAKRHPLLRKLGRSTVHRWLATGMIESIRLGSRWFTTTQAVERFFDRCNESNPTFETPKATRKSERLKEALAEFGVEGGAR